MEEIWKDIPGWEDYYQVSNLGRVKSVERDVWIPDNSQSPGYYRTYKSRIIRPKMERNGYLRLTLWRDRKYQMFSVHILVCMAWLNFTPSNELCINHKNGVKTDNRVENLEIVTYKENMAHALATGLRRTGFNAVRCVLTKEQAIEILNLRKNGMNLYEIADKYGVSRTAVSNAIKRLNN